MPKASVKKDPSIRADLSYSPFPMEQTIHTSQTIGELMPYYMDILQPGDKVRCNANLNARLLYLERPANEHIRLHCEWYFVPLQQLYKPFEQVFYGINDFESSMFDPSQVDQYFPYISISDIQAKLLDPIWNGSHGTEKTHEFQDDNLLVASRCRLIDSLLYPVRRIGDSYGSAPSAGLARNSTPWFALAYQKIWYDHFRLTDRIANNAKAYNMDTFYASQEKHLTDNALAVIFAPHLVPWMRDYYTHNFVSPLVPAGGTTYRGMTSILDGVDLGKVNTWLGLSDFQTATIGNLDQDIPQYDNSGDAVNVFPVKPELQQDEPVEYQHFNTANIRAAFAVEKLLEVTRRAGKHYDKQTLAHFGVEVPKGVNGECFDLGGFTQDIMIGDIVASATTEQSTLGELGGRGYTDTGAQKAGRQVEFEAKTHGVLMALCWFEPVPSYQQVGIDRLCMLNERTDFAIPEFDKLGMQPMFGFESQFDNQGNDTYFLGWKYRNAHFKEKHDVTRGAYLGAMSDWSASRAFANDVQVDDYYVQPDYLNPILSVQYGEGNVKVANWGAYDILDNPDISGAARYSQLYGQDPFVCDFYFKVDKLSKMSTYGLPNL